MIFLFFLCLFYFKKIINKYFSVFFLVACNRLPYFTFPKLINLRGSLEKRLGEEMETMEGVEHNNVGNVRPEVIMEDKRTFEEPP